MPRHNRGISLPINEEESSGNGNKSFLKFPKIGFFSVVGGAMAALSLKERWDAYRKVPSPPSGNGLADPPAYRDDTDAESAIGLEGGFDPEIPRRKRSKKNCCMCCGMDCTLFCKALGIAVLIFVLWNTFKLVRWWMTPAATGLENMPEYSVSLGCNDASYYYENNEDLVYTIPIDSRRGVYSMDLSGGAVGTLLIEPSGGYDADDVRVKTLIRSSSESLLDDVLITITDDPEVPGSYKLSTPTFKREQPNACMRYDLVLYLPPNLSELTITGLSTTQIKYSEALNTDLRILDSVTVELASFDMNNLLIVNEGILAVKNVHRAAGGYIVGKIPSMDSTIIDTRRGAAVAKVLVNMITSADATPTTLQTDSGSGRMDITFVNNYHRPAHNEHIAYVNGDMYLTYKHAGFNGRIDMDVRSYTAVGVQGTVSHIPGMPANNELPWHGDKEGHDTLKIKSEGWVGLYF